MDGSTGFKPRRTQGAAHHEHCLPAPDRALGRDLKADLDETPPSGANSGRTHRKRAFSSKNVKIEAQNSSGLSC